MAKLLSFESRVKNAGDNICAWWQDSINHENHWDGIGYKQGLRDALLILKRHKVIVDYSVIDGVKLYK